MNDRDFDQLDADEWIATIEAEHSRVRENDLYPLLKKWANQVAPKNVLDVGCGQGVCSEKLGLQDFNYTGVDASAFLLERAKALYPQPNKRFVAGNVYGLPFQEASFDAVFSIAVWHLLEDKSKAARELNRVLKRGGHFMIVAANPDFYEEWTKNYARSNRDGVRFEGFTTVPDGSESKDVLYLHSYDELVESLHNAGLEVEQVTTFRTALSIQGKKFEIG